MGLSFAFADLARDLSSNLSRGDYFLDLFAIYFGLENANPYARDKVVVWQLASLKNGSVPRLEYFLD